MLSPRLLRGALRRGTCALRRPLWLLLFLAALVCHAQNFDASRLRTPHLLDTPWLVHGGDDLRYAQPGFDDSHWTPYDPYKALTEVFPASHPAIVWYRLHVKVDPQDTTLALNEYLISHAFEIYVNGEQLLSSGRVQPFSPYTSSERMLRQIPVNQIATGSLVIAMRVHIAPTEWANGQMPGFYATNLSIGQYETLQHENWLDLMGGQAVRWIDRLSLIGLGVLALVMFSGQRGRDEYLWIAALGALTLVELPVPTLITFRNIPEYWDLLSDIPRVATPYIWAALYFSFVGHRVTWRWKIFLAFAGVCNALNGVQNLLFTSPLLFQLYGNFPLLALFAGVIPFVLTVHWRRGNREAGILLIPAILLSLYIYAEFIFATMFQLSHGRATALHILELLEQYQIGPFVLPAGSISSILSTLAFAIILMQRSMTMSRRQAQWEKEMEAAQEVQQVLVPEQTGPLRGFAVESVYEPAQQVGGDFFQILPDGEDGLLVVVGDVAGKGLPAAMLVSVLVGALRAAAEYTRDPVLLLANLNERLVGRAGGGFSTALAARISVDGEVTIANAGHLSPYLDGEEIELPGALPLGVTTGTEYGVVQFSMDPGSRLTFCSDGVVEAQNHHGELFGFERSRQIATQPASAIVEAAKKFGQQDDITVVAIERIGSAVAVA